MAKHGRAGRHRPDHRLVQFRHRRHRTDGRGRGAARHGRAHAVRAAERQRRDLGLGLRHRRGAVVRDPRIASSACGRGHSAAPSRRSSISSTRTIAQFVLETMAQARQSGADFSYTHRTILPDGTIRWLSGAGRIHLDEHGEAGARRRRLPGHHRTPHAGGAERAAAEDGSGRPAGRRRGPRLQQPADGDPGLLRAAAGRSRPGRSAPGRHRRDPEGRARAARGSPRQLLAFSRKQIIEPDPPRPERRGRRHGGDARTPHRRRREDRGRRCGRTWRWSRPIAARSSRSS